MAAACAVATGAATGSSAAPNHDAHCVQQHLGPIGLGGFFCNGEIGPVGERNFLHGFTASLAFVCEEGLVADRHDRKRLFGPKLWSGKVGF